jgi:AcrR family transcriptional regulator
MSKSEKTRQKILDAALKLFSAKSFNGTTTKEIAAAAGVAEGTIFRYFETKKDILLSLAGPIVIESLNDFFQQLKGADDETFLRALLKNRLQLVIENIELIRVVIYESQFHPEIRDGLVKDIILKAAGMLEQYLNLKIAAGDYRAVNPQVAARSLAGMLGIFIAWRGFLQGDKFIKFNDDEVIEEIVKIFLYGVKNQQEMGAKSCADGILPALLLL